MKIIMSVLVTVVMSLLLSVGWAWKCPSVGNDGAATKEGQCIVQQQVKSTIKKITDCEKTGKYNAKCNFKCNLYKVSQNQKILKSISFNPEKFSICFNDNEIENFNGWSCQWDNPTTLTCQSGDKKYSINIACKNGDNSEDMEWPNPNGSGKFNCVNTSNSSD